ncbi:MAG: alcohol dehydrogenase catalytic domain-containing protein [Sandaracinaceae bacterium]|nr:alcohol dehydrogenase catalytic domain-containing protein [Sandaracinaceae bacterium]
MNAIVQAAFGAPETVLRPAELPIPTHGPGDVLVRVVSAAVNTPDWLCTLGQPALLRPMYGWTRPRAPVRGSDFAGIVEAVGAEVTDLELGDAVFGCVGTNPFVAGFPGTFRIHTVAPAALVARKPPALLRRRRSGRHVWGRRAPRLPEHRAAAPRPPCPGERRLRRHRHVRGAAREGGGRACHRRVLVPQRRLRARARRRRESSTTRSRTTPVARTAST